jgi:methylenetetrahydrofolate reductase (NADPH)
MTQTFRESLAAGNEFVVTCELVPGRGYKGVGIDRVLQFAEQARDSPFIKGVSITDNAGGNPALSPDVLCPEIAALGSDMIVHFSCKDMNRNMVEARAYALKRAGITNLLVITGDYPIMGFFGLPKPVFDIDSVAALHYLSEMNRGLEAGTGKKRLRLEPTDFFLGTTASPFKMTEASSAMQYIKLEKKLRAGAHYVVTQLGYDARKSAEFIAYVRNVLGSDVPVMGSVYLLSAGGARFMNRGEVPGCYVIDRLLNTIEEEAKAPDKGKSARLERAARQIAILKGLRYNGVHIEGLNLRYDDVVEIMERTGEIGENWKELAKEFDYSPVSTYFAFSGGERIRTFTSGGELRLRETKKRRILNPKFWMTRVLHHSLFTPGALGYRLMEKVAALADRKPFLYRVFTRMELGVKRVLFDCRHCSDCALFETYYICPEARCPKGQRMGPCGGSRIDGKCEVFSNRYCVWEIAYWRAKNRGEIDKLRYVIPPRNWKLYETSSWVNYYLKRDHAAVKIELPEIARDVPRPPLLHPTKEGQR